MSSRLGTRATLATITVASFLAVALPPPASARSDEERLPTAPAPANLLPGTHGHSLLGDARPKVRRGRASVTKNLQYVGLVGAWQGAIDRCRGPVAYHSALARVPWIMAEHVHCGGGWALSARTGTTLRIANGALAGTWKANGRTRVVPLGSSTTVTRGLGALVAQTCIPGTRKVRLVGFDRT